MLSNAISACAHPPALNATQSFRRRKPRCAEPVSRQKIIRRIWSVGYTRGSKCLGKSGNRLMAEPCQQRVAHQFSGRDLRCCLRGATEPYPPAGNSGITWGETHQRMPMMTLSSTTLLWIAGLVALAVVAWLLWHALRRAPAVTAAPDQADAPSAPAPPPPRRAAYVPTVPPPPALAGPNPHAAAAPSGGGPPPAGATRSPGVAPPPAAAGGAPSQPGTSATPRRTSAAPPPASAAGKPPSNGSR